MTPQDGKCNRCSVIMGFDFGVQPPPYVNHPPLEPNYEDTHGCPRRDPRALTMLVELYEEGKISNTCGGRCEGIPCQDQ